MILQTRPQWLLAGSTVVFSLAAVFSAFTGGGDDNKSESSTTVTAIESTTTSSVPTTYIVNSGDSLSGIATLLGVDFNELIKLNGILDVDKIDVGDVLKVPPPTTTTSTTSTSTSLAESTTTTQ